MGKVPRLVNVAAQAGCLDQRGCSSGRPLRTRAMCTLLVGTTARTSAGVALQVPAGSAQGKGTPVPESNQLRRHLDTGHLRAGGWTLEGFYFYLKSPLLPSLSPQQYFQLCCSVFGLRSFLFASPWQAWERFPFFSCLGTIPDLHGRLEIVSQ